MNSTPFLTRSVTEFGAVGDGETMNTTALQAAIDAAHAAGGGTVFVPPGRWLTGTILVKSHVTLEIGAGAELLGSGDLADYPEFAYQTGETWRAKLDAARARAGEAPWQPNVDETDSVTRAAPLRHLVLVLEAENVTLCGRGTINGQGWHFWQPPSDERAWTRGQCLRPAAMVAVVKSRDVKIRDLRLCHAPFWTSDLYCSDRVEVTGITVENDPRAPNDDGLDISGSRDVIISNCRIFTGDDGIVINTRPRSVERVTVTNCIISSLCVALRVGWPNELCLNDIRQITFSNCVIPNSTRAVEILGNGGRTVEDIVINNIVHDSNVAVVVTRPIHISVSPIHASLPPGRVRNVTISNFTSRTQGRLLIVAPPGHLIENITLRDVRLQYVFLEDPAEYAPHLSGGRWMFLAPDARRARAAVVAQNVTNLRVEGLEIQWPTDAVPEEWRLPWKRGNGTHKVFEPAYEDTRAVPFHVLWARQVNGGRFEAAGATASHPDTAPTVLEDSSIVVEL